MVCRENKLKGELDIVLSLETLDELKAVFKKQDELKAVFKKQFEELLNKNNAKDLVVFPKLDDDGVITGEYEGYRVMKDNWENILEIEGFLEGAKNVLTGEEIFDVFAKYKNI